MKDFSKSFGFIALAAVMALALAGCSPTVESVSLSGGDTIEVGDSLKFNATVSGKNKPSQSVTWSVSSKSDGSGAVAGGTDISPSGVLVVDEKETATTLYVKAVSTQNADKFDYIQVKVKKPAATSTAAKPAATVTSVTKEQNTATTTDTTAQTATAQTTQTATVTGVRITSPQNNTKVKKGGTLQFTAKVDGTNNPSQEVTWSVKMYGGRGSMNVQTTIDENGLLSVANNETVNLRVTATSKLDPSKFEDIRVDLE